MSAVRDDQDLQKAYALHQRGSLKEAAALYRALIKRNANNYQALHLLGLIEASQGNLDQAKVFMSRSLAVRPPNVQFIENYASILFQTADFKAALEAAQQGLQLNSGSLPLAYLRAIALFKLERFEEALAQFDKILLLQPNNTAALNERGSVLAALKRYDAALASIQKAVALAPNQPEAQLNLGNVFSELKRYDDAIAAYQKALAARPNMADPWLGLGNVYRALKRPEDALSAYDKALALNPNLAGAWLGKGNLFLKGKHYGEALAAYDSAISLQPDFAEPLRGRGMVFFEERRFTDALYEFKKALSMKSEAADFWLDLGDTLKQLLEFQEASSAYDKALAINPEFAEAWVHRGDLSHMTGRLAESLREFDKALSIKPDLSDAISGKIFAADFADDTSFEKQQAARKRWWEAVGAAIHARSTFSYNNVRDPQRRIRVGYVSGDFLKHSAALSFKPVLFNHDKSQIEIVCYSSNSKEDELTDEFRRIADRWRDVTDLSDDELGHRVHSDQIDILVDLSGHTERNRLATFAHKPAPIQVTAWGHASGTGLPTIDYLFSDPVACPAEFRPLFAERICDLPCLLSIDPLSEPVQPAAPSVLSKGFLTFGVFNRAAKVSDEAIALWSRILDAIPQSQILFKNGGFDAPLVRSSIVNAFAKCGIAVERIQFLGFTSRAEHLAAFERVDISLDPFPNNGGISTWESLQVGVPVIAKLGNGIASRVGGAIVSAIGLSDWVADSADGYLAIAQKFAALPDHLKTLRANLPAMISRTAAGNSVTYTRAVEAAYRKMWTDYCRSS